MVPRASRNRQFRHASCNGTEMYRLCLLSLINTHSFFAQKILRCQLHVYWFFEPQWLTYPKRVKTTGSLLVPSYVTRLKPSCFMYTDHFQVLLALLRLRKPWSRLSLRAAL
jgi:hypothetical protein